MILNQIEIKKELKKIELREIYRRYCSQNEVLGSDIRQFKGYDQIHDIEEAIGIRIESLKELQVIHQEKCKEKEIAQLTELLNDRNAAREYLTKEYKKMGECIVTSEQIEIEEKTSTSADLLYR